MSSHRAQGEPGENKAPIPFFTHYFVQANRKVGSIVFHNRSYETRLLLYYIVRDEGAIFGQGSPRKKGGMMKDIRWIQRYSNFIKALSNLNEAVELANERDLSKLEKQGLIQSFEYTFELAWNTIRDFYRSKGEVDIQGSRDAFRLAYERGLIEEGQVFMNMIKSRQLSSHTFNEETANEIYQDIVNQYFSAFKCLSERLKQEKRKEEN